MPCSPCSPAIAAGRARRSRWLVPFVPLALLGSTLACSRSTSAPRAADDARPSAADLFALGRAAARAGDATRAEQYLLASLAEGYDPAAALPVLLRVCVSQRRLRAALDHAERHLRQAPAGPELRYLVATLRIGVGETDSARAELERLATGAPESAPAHFLLGALLSSSDRARARGHLERYLELRPDGPRAAEAREALARLAAAAPAALPGGEAP
jgi:tetratricopeptide (TPR) repeat protein